MASLIGNVSESQSVSIQLQRKFKEAACIATQTYNELVALHHEALSDLKKSKVSCDQYIERVGKVNAARINDVKQRILINEKKRYITINDTNERGLVSTSHFRVTECPLTSVDQVAECCLCDKYWTEMRAFEICFSPRYSLDRVESTIQLSEKDIHEITIHKTIRHANRRSLQALGLLD